MKDNKALEDFQKLMKTPEGKKLVKLLNQDGGKALKQAGTALQQGDETGARDTLTPLLEQREIKALLEKLNRTMGHG